MSTDPSIKSKAYLEMEERWELPRTLFGGTVSMRKTGEKYLPKHAAEHQPVYDARLKRTTLRNFYRKTVMNLTSKIFSKDVVLEDTVPSKLKKHCENLDLMGGDHNQVFREWLLDAINKGLSHLLVDFPTTPTARSASNTVTLADERAAGLRPYTVQYKAEQVLSWRSKFVDGVEVLTQVVLQEEVTEEKTAFEDESIKQIRVLRPGEYEIWQQKAKGGWVKTSEGTTSIKFIPLVTLYTNRTGFMRGEPPLEDLAWTNLEHWQVRSDQRTALSVCSFPILAASGWTKDKDGEVAIGPLKMLATSDVQGKFYYVESQGAHLKAGQEELEHLENTMRLYGLQFEVPKSGNTTATARAIDAAEGAAPVKQWSLALKDAGEQVLNYMAIWEKLGENAGGTISTNTDLGLSLKDVEETKILLEARRNREITQKTFLSELVRRGILKEEFDVDAEVELTKDEVVEFSMLENPQDSGQPNGEAP